MSGAICCSCDGFIDCDDGEYRTYRKNYSFKCLSCIEADDQEIDDDGYIIEKEKDDAKSDKIPEKETQPVSQ